jgi:hypothetical protein
VNCSLLNGGSTEKFGGQHDNQTPYQMRLVSFVSSSQKGMERKCFRVVERPRASIGEIVGTVTGTLTCSSAYLYPSTKHTPVSTMKTAKKLLILKRRGSSSPKVSDPNARTPGLEQAKTVFKALANVGDGAINIPGLKAAAQLVIQIIEVVQVSRRQDK